MKKNTVSEYRWLNEASQAFLEKDYLISGQTVDDRVNIIANRAEEILGEEGFAEKFKDYFKRGWFSLSTPIWANFGTKRALPISCFGSYIEDTMESIVSTWSEVSMQTKFGGGTSAYFGNLRHRGAPISTNGESSGAVHFMQLFDNLINIVSQGKVRRGNFAAYLDIDHPDILEFLSIRTEGSPLQDISFGVCVSDDFMNEMIGGDVEKRKVWARVLEARTNVGYPYIFFTDNANNGAADVYIDKEMRITHSNLCSEIALPDSADESFVCDLSSMNILYYDEWKDTDAVRVVIRLLDAVMTEFIEKAEGRAFMERSVNFAKRHRALGLGWLGWHSYLQSKLIAFESIEAKGLSSEIAKHIQDKALEASRELAQEFGEPEVLEGYGRRNTTLTAIAPTKSSAFILGQVSEGIEPHKTNYYIKDLAKGKFTIKNSHLEELLEEKGKNDPETWKSILMAGGSVQHLDFLSESEKAVFKTFKEIAPKEVILQTSIRQKYIDQGQSVNLMIDPKVPTKEINKLMIEAWESGVKSLYYQHSVNAAQQLSRSLITCENCEG
jgi:ribonucleoside-diphosphate reductase alpha chain